MVLLAEAINQPYQGINTYQALLDLLKTAKVKRDWLSGTAGRYIYVPGMQGTYSLYDLFDRVLLLARRDDATRTLAEPIHTLDERICGQEIVKVIKSFIKAHLFHPMEPLLVILGVVLIVYSFFNRDSRKFYPKTIGTVAILFSGWTFFLGNLEVGVRGFGILGRTPTSRWMDATRGHVNIIFANPEDRIETSSDD